MSADFESDVDEGFVWEVPDGRTRTGQDEWFTVFSRYFLTVTSTCQQWSIRIVPKDEF